MPAAEAEIYVTTGPDGIEVYSNLPRKPPGLRVAAAASNPEPAQMAVLPSPGRRDEGLASHVAEPGKSFLLDD
ncbi:MAG: hypothetical protein H6R14_2474 [Proteobacteria bacterium]|nr:hypothetical protein [Pseudomonadota bacterium]